MNPESAVKRDFTRLAAALLLYELVFQIGSGFLMLHGFGLLRQADVATTLMSLLGLFLMHQLLGRGGLPDPKPAPFHLQDYLWLLMIIYGLQTFSSFLLAPLVHFLHAHGFAMSYASDVASGRLTGFWAVLYAAIIAPLTEECLFRGLIYRYLGRFGRLFAIFISALLFGLVHLNLLQFPTAVLVGLLLACIRMRYGLRYAILMHISNNAFALIFNNFSGSFLPIELLYAALIYGGLAVMVVSLIRCAGELRNFIRHENGCLPMLRIWFRTPAVCVITVLFVIMTLSSIYE